MPDRTAAEDAFYVGYFPLPARDRRFLRWLLPALLILIAAAGVLLAAGQRDPGTGAWDTGKQITLEGTLQIDPYAILFTHEGAEPRAVLLVDEGKFGAAERARPFAGQHVKVAGTLLHRDGRNMIELSSAPDGITALSDATPATITPMPLGVQTLTGEIIDPKCYLGAMKPGGGKTHKACAELCISGGIPPMLATWQNGHEAFYLLTNADGTPANAWAAPHAGEAVTLTGNTEKRGDLLVMCVSQ